MTIINGRPVSQRMWHVKEPSLLNDHECRAKPFTGSGYVPMSEKFPCGTINFKKKHKQTNKRNRRIAPQVDKLLVVMYCCSAKTLNLNVSENQ